MWWINGLTLAFHSRNESQVNTRASASCTLLNQLMFWIGHNVSKEDFINKKIDIYSNSCPLLMSHVGNACDFVFIVKCSLPVVNLMIQIFPIEGRQWGCIKSPSRKNLVEESPSSLVSFVSIFKHGNSLRKTQNTQLGDWNEATKSMFL